MQFEKFKNVNRLSHLEVPRYIRSLIELYTAEHGSKGGKLIESLEEDLCEFEALLGEAFENEDGRRLDTLERERYRYFEQVVDRLDDNLLVFIRDYLGELRSLGMTEVEALMRIPEYGASLKILEKPDGEVYFPSQAHKHGHNWEPEEVAFLITRLKDPLLKEQIRIAGVTEAAHMLVGIDERINSLLSQEKVSITEGVLNEIRKKRYFPCLHVYLLIYRIGTEKVHKTRRHISVYDTISDILEMKEEQKSLAKFSYNDFSHTIFRSLVEKYRDPIANENTLATKIREDFEKEFREYTTVFQAFLSHPLWSELDAFEANLYRNMENLLTSIAARIGCIGADETGRWEKHIESDTYKAACSLLESIPQNWYDNLKSYERGQSLHPLMLNAMLETWDDVVHRVSLKILNREELFNDCKSSDESARLLAERIHHEREDAVLNKLRNARYGLIIIIRVSHIMDKRQPEHK